MSKRIVASLLILGCVLILVGLYIRTLDFGSTPMIPANSSLTYYHTFQGTNIYITPTGNSIAFVGAVILVLTLAMFAGQRSTNPKAHMISFVTRMLIVAAVTISIMTVILVLAKPEHRMTWSMVFPIIAITALVMAASYLYWGPRYRML